MGYWSGDGNAVDMFICILYYYTSVTTKEEHINTLISEQQSRY